MEDPPAFIEDPSSAPKRGEAGLEASRRVPLEIAGQAISVEVHWPAPEGGFGLGALAGLHLAAPDPRRHPPVCLVPMESGRVHGALRGDVYVVQDAPERLDFLLWVAVPAWRTEDDQARLIPAGVLRHEEVARALKGPWPEAPPEPRAVATAALVGVHAIQRLARRGPAAAERWVVGEGWPRGINLQEVLMAARENRPVAVGVLPGS